jgi:hypothetical protein
MMTLQNIFQAEASNRPLTIECRIGRNVYMFEEEYFDGDKASLDNSGDKQSNARCRA